MKKIGIIAHFGFGKNLSNGQTIKARVFLEAMRHHLGETEIETVDTHGGAKRVPGLLIDTVKLFWHCENIVILPADKGLRFLLPLTALCNSLHHRKLFHVVIGGWLPEFLLARENLQKIEKNYDGIYVETIAMQKALEKQEFNNVAVLPNCKSLKKLTAEDLKPEISEPYHLCTFSRVMKEKGIEDAVEAVKAANRQLGRNAFELEIYGQVWKTYVEDFEKLKSTFPKYIRYMGTVPFDQSVETLSRYTALLFPTYYEGEGFAGTLIDAMAAGVPAIVSNWKYNKEVVVPGKTGVLIDNCTVEKITTELVKIAQHPEAWNKMKASSLKESEKYDANAVYTRILEDMKK